MTPNRDQSSLGLEYFCNQGDEIWNMADEELVELGKREVDRLGSSQTTRTLRMAACSVWRNPIRSTMQATANT